MNHNVQTTLEQFVDYLMPELTPHEASLYIFLYRNSHLCGKKTIRIGQRTIAKNYGKGPKKATPSRTHILRQLKMLEEKGAIAIGDTNRDGTMYTIFLPNNVPLIADKLSLKPNSLPIDYYTEKDKRQEIYERDEYICQYCGEKVNDNNATIDHCIPQHKGGKHTKDNLKTCCLICNSIKSGKSYEEAAPYLLRNIKDRNKKK